MRQLQFKGRLCGAIGVFETFTIDWPERPTNADMLAVYNSYEHIQSPRLVEYDDDGEPIKTPYPEFYNLA